MEGAVGHVGDAIRPHVNDARILDMGEEGHVVIEPGIAGGGSGDETLAARRVADQVFMDGVERHDPVRRRFAHLVLDRRPPTRNPCTDVDRAALSV